jgi:hypothetical protein
MRLRECTFRLPLRSVVLLFLLGSAFTAASRSKDRAVVVETNAVRRRLGCVALPSSLRDFSRAIADLLPRGCSGKCHEVAQRAIEVARVASSDYFNEWRAQARGSNNSLQIYTT